MILWNIQPCVLLYLVSHCQLMLYQLSYIWRQNWTGLTVHSSLGSIRQLPTRPNEKLSAVYFLNQHTCFECAWLINKVFFFAKFISQSCKISVSIANSWLKRGSIGDANISLSIAEKGVKASVYCFKWHVNKKFIRADSVYVVFNVGLIYIIDDLLNLFMVSSA